MEMEFECSKCPIYRECALAHADVFGGVLVSRWDIDSCEDCPLYRK